MNPAKVHAHEPLFDFKPFLGSLFEATWWISSLQQRRVNSAQRQRAKVFVEQVLERQPGEVLTLTNAYVVFTEFLKLKSMVPVKRSIFKGMFAPLIRDAFNLGLRNDVIDQATNHQTAGWKGLRALQVQEMAEKGSNS